MYGTAQVQRRTRLPVLCSNLDYLLRLSLEVLTQIYKCRGLIHSGLMVLARVTQVV